MKNYSTIVAPFLLWSYVIPFITSLMFAREMLEVEQENTIDATEEREATTIMEMVEVEAPIGWLEYFTKLILFGIILFAYLLLTIYFSQEGLLYVPD